jgi:hypothetical protein
LRNEGDPLLGELRVVVEDLLGAVKEERLAGALWGIFELTKTYRAVSM